MTRETPAQWMSPWGNSRKENASSHDSRLNSFPFLGRGGGTRPRNKNTKIHHTASPGSGSLLPLALGSLASSVTTVSLVTKMCCRKSRSEALSLTRRCTSLLSSSLFLLDLPPGVLAPPALPSPPPPGDALIHAEIWLLW